MSSANKRFALASDTNAKQPIIAELEQQKKALQQEQTTFRRKARAHHSVANKADKKIDLYRQKLEKYQQKKSKEEKLAEENTKSSLALQPTIASTTEQLSFLMATQPGADSALWKEEAKQVADYVISSTSAFFGASEGKRADIQVGHDALRAVEEKRSGLSKLYRCPAVLELIGKGLLVLNNDFYAIDEDLYECLFNKDFHSALRERIVDADVLVAQLKSASAIEDIFIRTNFKVSFDLLFTKGLDLLRQKKINLDAYFSSENALTFLEEATRKAAEPNPTPSSSELFNKLPSLSFSPPK